MNTDVALLALFVTVSCVIVSNMTSKVEWKRGFLTEQSTSLALARHFRITIRPSHNHAIKGRWGNHDSIWC